MPKTEKTVDEVTKKLRELKVDTKETKADLSAYEITDEHIDDLVAVIENNKTLKEITIKYQKLSKESQAKILSSLNNNSTLNRFTAQDCCDYYDSDDDDYEYYDFQGDIDRSIKKQQLIQQLDDPKQTKLIIKDFNIFIGSNSSIFEKLQKVTHIEELHLTFTLSDSKDKITDEHFAKLASYLKSNPKIRVLNLSGNSLSDKSIDLLAEIISSNTNLQWISIHSNSLRVGHEYTKFSENKLLYLSNVLSENLHITRLHVFNPSETRRSNDYFYKTQEAIDNYCKRNLQLRDNLKTSIPQRELKFSNVALNKTTLTKLCEQTKEKEITRLEFIGCAFNQDSIELLAKLAQSVVSLYFLNLSGSKMGDNGIKILVESLVNVSSLVELNLSNNNVSDEGGKAIGNLLQSPQTSLALLNISENQIKHEGFAAIADGIKKNKTLFSLNASWNPIPGTITSTLADALKVNKTLISLYLRYSDISDIESLIKEISPSEYSKKADDKKTEAALNKSICCFLISQKELYTLKYNDSYQQRYKEASYKKSSRDNLEKYTTRNKANAQNLIIAVEKGDARQVSDLISKASIHTQREETGDTLLHIAIKKQHNKIVKLLLQQGSNTKIRNKAGYTPYEIAEQQKNEEIIALLENPAKSIGALKPFFTVENTATTPAVQQPKRKTGNTEQFASNNAPGTIQAFLIAEPAKKHKIESPAKTESYHQYVNPSKLEDEAKSSESESVMDVQPSLPNADDFFNTVATGNLYKLEKYLHAVPELLYEVDEFQNTALHIAAFAGQLACTELFLKQYQPEIEATNQERLTPLQLVVSSLLRQKSGDEFLTTNRLKIAWLLIQKGAAIHMLLPEAAAAGHYRLVKIMLSSSSCNVNDKDAKGYTALDWAAEKANQQILDRLLIEPGLKKETINTALTKAKQPQVIKLLEDTKELTEKNSLPKQKSGIQWMKSFSIYYGSRFGAKRKPLSVQSDEQHSHLALQNMLLREKGLPSLAQMQKDAPELESVIKEVKDCGNPVTASLTFIVSSESYLRNKKSERSYISVNLDFVKDYHISHTNNDDETLPPEEIERIRYRIESAPQDAFDSDFRNARWQAISSEELNQLFDAYQNAPDENERKKVARQIYECFHHGEQALLDYLEQEQTINLIVQKLAQHPQFITGCKIYGVILNIHSPRYTCENCEIGLLGEQNSEKSLFLTQLSKALLDINCILPQFSPIRMLTQISSYINYHIEKISEAEHQMLQVDMRSCHNRLILAKDISAIKTSVTQFHSSKKMTL